MSWRESRADHAADRILDAAERLFAAQGVSAVGMGEVARAAGCSRATLYRYFDSRQALRLAYVHREARRVVTTVESDLARLGPGQDRRTEAIVRTIEELRARPHLAGWLRPGERGVLEGLLESSEVVGGFVAAFLGPAERHDSHLGRWLMRVILSFVVLPGGDAEEERRQVRDFVVPVLPAVRS